MITNIPLRLKDFNSHLHINQAKKILKILNIPQADVIHKAFVGGNMFMSRTKIFKNILTKNKIKIILQLLSKETGKVVEDKSGTYTHAMERIFGYIIPYLNYTFNAETTSDVIKIQNDKASNKLFNIIKLYNNDCYAIEEINIYGKIIYQNSADIKIQWLHTSCDPVLYTKLNNNTYIQYTTLLKSQFNEKFYQEMYPDTSGYYNGDKMMLYDHYVKYGLYEGRFPNASSYNQSLTDNKQKLHKLWQNKKWKLLSNKLNCICLLTTHKELLNKKYDKFINALIKSCSHTLYKNITFKIIINTTTDIHKHNSIKELKKIFKTVQINNVNIQSKEDIYIKNFNNKNDVRLPKQGLKSGPNLCFFEAIKLCKNHNTTLMLETDCILGKNWLTKINNYVQSCGPFLVSGSIYDGLTHSDPGSIMSTHINGGTSLYHTGNKMLQSLMSLLKEKIAYEVHTKNNIGLSYDYALKLMIDNNLKLNDKSYELWKFINKYYISNPLIINLSTDNDTGHLNINQKYNFAILHKK
jgi:hypothetical protein